MGRRRRDTGFGHCTPESNFFHRPRALRRLRLVVGYFLIDLLFLLVGDCRGNSDQVFEWDRRVRADEVHDLVHLSFIGLVRLAEKQLDEIVAGLVQILALGRWVQNHFHLLEQVDLHDFVLEFA